MRTTLFRQEALDGQTTTMVGSLLAARRLPFGLVTALSVAAALALVALCVFGQYTRKAHVGGYLAPSTGLIRVVAGQSGTLLDKRVKEGQRVKRGDVLFVLSTERMSAQAGQVQARVTGAIGERAAALDREYASQRGVARLQLDGARRRLQSMQSEAEQVRSMLALQQQRVAGAEAALANHERLQADGFMPAAQVDLKRNELLEQRARLGELLRGRSTLEREMNLLELELQTAALNEARERSRHERERSQLAQEGMESESRGAQAIVAPADGVATAVLGEVGQSTQGQTVLLTIVPADATLQALLLVPSRAIGFLAVGDTVSLRYQAFPYQRYGAFRGRVVEIPRAMVTSQEAGAPQAPDEAVYRVNVALESQQVPTGRAVVPLQSGMSLEADVWLERRTLLEWMFEPLLGLARIA
ncbi:MAG: HlyD family efflux transporter periplasmic adaptor subunit [Burkholderiales bacterium]|nr:HlyD family efflux transporter periplasmic adaptor subunit [Burkholderiales bacterium]